MANTELTYCGLPLAFSTGNGWILELLVQWSRDESLLPVHDQRGHPMWRRLDEQQPGSDEQRALCAALAELHTERPEEYEAICRAFKPWVGIKAATEIDSAVLHTAIKRLADAVDAAMGD